MAGSEWENFGDEIRRTVQEAVENNNYYKLNQTITDTVDRAMGAAMNSVTQGLKNVRSGQPKENRQYRYHQDAGFQWTNTGYQQNLNAGYQQNGVLKRQQNAWQTAPVKKQGQAGMPVQNLPVLYKKTTGVRVTGTLLGIAGGGIGLGFAFYTLASILAAVLGGYFPEYLIVAGICGLTAAGGLGLMKYGFGLKKLEKRFQRMVQGIGNREYCDVKELADMNNRTEEKTIKDLKRMNAKGWFHQGHFDESKKCFITSDRMYQEYTRLSEQRRQEALRLEEKRAEAGKREEKISKLSPEAKRVIEEGDAFVEKIRACNDAIPGEEISAKISRMEMLIDRIFDRVEEKPDTIPDIRKLMDYYLPTTIKLLEAYQELDEQPIEGENIRASKREIEDTLDTLNYAFEKILDDLFHRTAWDVSSDISVLNTMLAREGLTDDGMKLS